MHIQIYSIMTVEEALAVAEAGADRIGILVTDPSNPNHFPCEISEDQAAPIFAALKGVATSVLISVALNEESVIRQAERLNPDVLHLCAGVKGSVEFKNKLKSRCPGIELMEAVGVQDESSLDEAIRISEYADTIILDSVDPNIAGIGAAGVTHDWNLDKQIIDSVSVPVIMAGGLGPDNVSEVLKFRPWGVDSLTKTSKIENGVIIGKDIDKVRRFCEIVKDDSFVSGGKTMDILCVGDLNGDLVFPYGKALKQVKGDDPVQVSFRVGGTMGNMAQHLGLLGDHPYFVGDLCSDSIGRSLQTALTDLGVDLSYATEGNNVAMLCVAVVEENGDRLILPWFPPGSTLPRLTKESFSKVPRRDYWLFSSGMMMSNEEETMKSVVDFFREMKETTNSVLMFDMNLRIESYGLNELRRHYYDEMLSLCDVIIGNYKYELDFFTSSDNMVEGCQELGKNKVVICHNGAENVLVVDHGDTYYVPVTRVETKHTIGAGDIFNAGVLHGLRLGMDMRSSVEEGITQARRYLTGESDV